MAVLSAVICSPTGCSLGQPQFYTKLNRYQPHTEKSGIPCAERHLWPYPETMLSVAGLKMSGFYEREVLMLSCQLYFQSAKNYPIYAFQSFGKTKSKVIFNFLQCFCHSAQLVESKCECFFSLNFASPR